MKRLEEAERNYREIPVPEELSGRVRAGIAGGKRRTRRRAVIRSLSTAAACFAVVFAGLNLSPVMASAAADIPVAGGLFRLMTVRSYETGNEDVKVSVKQPGVEGGGQLSKTVNAEIQKIVKEKTAEGQQMVQEYKDAFFATGGTREEWEQHDNQVVVTYEVKSQTGTTVSFVVQSAVSIANAWQEDYYYNLDIASGRELTLEDLLGEDWAAVCNASIQKQMAEAEDPSVYFSAGDGGFTTVDENTEFYINRDGNPVVVFPPYAVAPGALGSVEFEIRK